MKVQRMIVRAAAMMLTLILGMAVIGPKSGTAEAPQSEWLAYAARFVTDDGRVVDTGNGFISHSEGQGYGMLLASAHDDRARFDRLWAWTRAHLQIRGDRLFAWRWDPAAGKATDLNSASDGDILIAWALVRGGRQWQEPAFLTEAAGILADVRAKLTVDSRFGPLLLPGPEGFRREKSVVVNPSYWLWPAFETFAEVDPSPVWRGLGASGVELLRAARFGRYHLPTDWVEVLDDTVRPAEGFPPEFGFNAVRIPLYAAWASGKTGEAPAGTILDFWASFNGRSQIPATANVANESMAAYGLSAGGRAISVLARFGAAAEPMFPSLGPTDDYYSATLLLLTKIAHFERFER
jgi:endoglucanase